MTMEMMTLKTKVMKATTMMLWGMETTSKMCEKITLQMHDWTLECLIMQMWLVNPKNLAHTTTVLMDAV